MSKAIGNATVEPGSKSVNIRDVPREVWEHARMNAIKTQLPFGEYCILLLMDGGVYAPNPPNKRGTEQRQ